MAERHAPYCDPGGSCVECGGCDCGLIEARCTGAGCHSVDAYLQDCDEDGRDPNGGLYGVFY